METIRANIERVAQGFPSDREDYIILRITTALGANDIEVPRTDFLMCVIDLIGEEIQIDETTTYTIRKNGK